MCLTCQWKLGQSSVMEEVNTGVFLCRVCKTMKATEMAAPVLMTRSGIASILYIGGFIFLLLATALFTTFPALEIPLTWTMLYSLYLVYFGLAFTNLRRKLYV